MATLIVFYGKHICRKRPYSRITRELFTQFMVVLEWKKRIPCLCFSISSLSGSIRNMSEWLYLSSEYTIGHHFRIHNSKVVEWLEQLGYGAESRRIA